MTDKEKIIIYPNSNLKSYILNLQHERDELRKYLIDICNLLSIDTRQSLLGTNCLEFYTVLSSTAENKIKELKEWREANQPTGICETCTVKSVEDMYKYKKALDEIGKLISKFESSDGCDYGDFDCENCSDLDEDTVCAYKLKKVIKGIINKVKGETNEES